MRRAVLGCMALFAAYFVLARFGLLMGAVAGFAAPVWPATGIALVALRMFGLGLWPGVFAGALAVNLHAGASILTAVGIACGNTLEAVVGSWLLGRARFHPAFERIEDVMALIVLAALCSTAVSASIGVGSLLLSAVVHGEGAFDALRAWWIGDALGDLVVAPALFIAWARPRLRGRPGIVAEAVLLAIVIGGVGVLVFGHPSSFLRHPFILFPPLAWAALRYGQYGAMGSVLISSAIAIAGTAMGLGPFVERTLSDSLLQVQVFMGIAAVTALLLGSAIAERNRAIDARDEFLSIAAHELRTPLTALSLHTQGLLRQLRGTAAPPSRAEIEERLTATGRLLARLTRLIEELLEVSRIATGAIELRREAVDLADVARESLSRFEVPLAEAGCKVELTAEGDLHGQWDPARLEQVVDNLISNAVKYGAGKPVEIHLRDRGDRAEIEVRDHGIGIEHGDQQRIFERFERAVSRRRFGGFGLGLWIARRVIEAHGGAIRLTSAPGTGSTFIVELPR
ncbi:MAG: MASE1 domain-containing protein [Myxococcales bacterium]|nr:MASE1 domain-containing protein [Myxococcales bacterium]